MCGILGFTSNNSKLDYGKIKDNLSQLFLLSESRGKESSGIAIKDFASGKINILKEPIPASQLIKTQEYFSFLEKFLPAKTDQPVALIGHSRLVTDGSEDDNNNNQPVVKSKGVVIHNGIVTNVKDLWTKYGNKIKRAYEVDTEIILDLLRLGIDAGKALEEALKDVFRELEGAASIAILMEDSHNLLLATNTGSLYCGINKKDNILFFASEKYIISKLIKTLDNSQNYEIEWIKPYTGKVIDAERFLMKNIDFNEFRSLPVHHTKHKYNLYADYDTAPFEKLKRCTKCLLPETFPFIEFDEHGVCNYCGNYKKRVIKGKDELEKILEPYKSKNGEPDCIVTLSGGRDSTYGLHYAKKELKMNPVAFTYDWAMVTDLARRNQARICGRLGVENIVVSANIRQKRSNIKKNIIAWLKKPDLGVIPIFMAGDKQVYHYVHKLQDQTGIKLIIWMDNKLETTDFKFGFSGIEPLFDKRQTDSLILSQKIRLIMYYLKSFLRNPSYINSSMFDTIWAYYSQFFKPRTDICSLYEYIEWDEEKITSTLMKEYNWETAVDTVSTWRIGDETAPFYNYIYYTMAGFTENDTFRSNQIREGLIARERALELIREENRPRPESINLYFKKIKLNMDFKDLQKTLKPYLLKLK
jgi:glucosamine--fructose-6-phosphate aminotransferase (isomerizing)